MGDRVYELTAVPIREVAAGCGCAFVECAPRALDARGGKFLVGRQIVVVPCSEAHREIAVTAAARVGAPEVEDARDEFEKLIAGG